MALDRKLSRDFWLHEFNGWKGATEVQVAELQEFVARVLQPLRSAMGVEVIPTSWLVWSNGEPRTGTHAHGAVDFIVADGRTREGHKWLHRYVLPTGYLARLIYEPTRAADPSRNIPAQGEHIHAAPMRAQVAVQGAAGRTIQALIETAEGVYEHARLGLGAGALALSAVVFFCSRVVATASILEVRRAPRERPA